MALNHEAVASVTQKVVGLSSSSSSMDGQGNGYGSITDREPERESKLDGIGMEQGSTATCDAAPKTTTFEFLGPPGAILISVLVPFFSYFFALGCSERGCPPLPVGSYLINGLYQIVTLQFWVELWDTEGVLVYLSWYIWTVLCWAVLPGQWMEGGKLRNGEKLSYKINGTFYFLLQFFFANANQRTFRCIPLCRS